MRRRTYIGGLGTAVTAGLAGCKETGEGVTPDDPTPTEGPGDGTDGDGGLSNPSFESGLDGWTTGEDLPEDPGGDGELVDHGTEVTSQVASDGEQAVQFYISGVADDGTLWVEQQVDLTGVEAVTVDGYSEQESFNILSQVAFFAGEKPDEGLEEADFDRSEDLQDHSGWKTYRYDVSSLSGQNTVAVGMNVIWETDIYGHLDNVRLETDSTS